MKALSIKQPWAALIAHGIKDIENRTWRTHFRGRIYIHASGKGIPDFEFTREQHKVLLNIDTEDMNFHKSAIIGEVEIVDCVINNPSIWAEKTFMYEYDDQVGEKPIGKPIYNWVLANAKLYDKPILNVKGKLSFWYPDNDIVECIGCSQKFDAEFMQQDDGGEKFCSVCWGILSPIMAQEAKEIEESQFCECSEPNQSLFPNGEYKCLNEGCFKVWYH
ncbi:MAG: ASCH domain-containing protein [Bacteroidota bacterium]